MNVLSGELCDPKGVATIIRLVPKTFTLSVAVGKLLPEIPCRDACLSVDARRTPQRADAGEVR